MLNVVMLSVVAPVSMLYNLLMSNFYLTVSWNVCCWHILITSTNIPGLRQDTLTLGPTVSA
jgi:hypothetical protein